MRATIKTKLALPFALFLAPIAFLLYFLVQTHDRGIFTAQNELSGVNPVLASLDFSKALTEIAASHRNKADLDRAQARLKVALEPFKSSKAVQDNVAELFDRLDTLRRLKTLSVADSAPPLESLVRTIRSIGDVSELILDPDLDTYYLMDMLVVLSPDIFVSKRDILQDMQTANGQGQSKVAAGGQLYYHARELSGLIERLDTSVKKAQKHSRSAASSEPFIVAAQQYQIALEGLKNAWSSDTNLIDLNQQLFESLEVGARWQQETARELQRLLKMRIDSFSELRNQQIMISAIMFMIAAVVMIWLTRRFITEPLTDLTGSMIKLADGQLDVALPRKGGSGEVGDMIRAVSVFKDNAIRNRVLEDEKLEAAAALALAANNLERAEAIAGLGHWQWDMSRKAIDWSPSLFEITGFCQKSGAPRLLKILRRVPKTDRAKLVRYLVSIFRRNQTQELSFGFDHPEFGTRQLHSQISIERSSNGGITAILGIVHDITERHQNEKKLEARTAALAEAQAIGRIGDWSYALGESHIRWSPEIFSLLRYESTSFDTTREAVIQLYQDDGSEVVLKAQADVIRTGETRSVDVRIRLGDGTISDFTVVSKAAFNTLGQITGFSGTIQDISERKTAERELEKLAFYDPLTGLANRALFRRNLRREIERAIESDQSGALMLLDLDRFKEVNDSLGHAAGDELLVVIADHLRRILPAKAFLSRLGGDEFAIVIGGVDAEQAAAIGKTITIQIAEPVRLMLGEVQIGTSIGIAMFPTDGTRQDDLVRNADLALYNAKDDGRSCLRFFTPKLSDAVQEKSLIARDLRRAIGVDDQLFVVFQPQVDIQRGKVMGFEALLRWRHPERGLISPGVFVPIAESSSLIGDLGLHVLRASCFQMKAWIDAGEPPRDIAVNVSATQIWQSDFECDVKQILMETELPPELLTLEVTESVFLREAEGRVRQSLDSLKALGVKLALDDFGTGYSSLSYLNHLPFDKLKIDRRFIAGVHRSEERMNLLKGIIELGLGLGMTVVAEGAEHLDEVRALRALNCHSVQGYVFSHPLEGPSAARAAALLDLMVPSNPKMVSDKKAA